MDTEHIRSPEECAQAQLDAYNSRDITASGSVHAVATYECVNGKIRRAWFVREAVA